MSITYTPYQVPLQPEAQQFTVSLAGVTYTLKLKWNTQNGTWVMDIMDSNQNPIISGVPLITGADLLEQFAYLGIGGSLIVQSTNDPNLVPDFQTLGATGNLFFVVAA